MLSFSNKIMNERPTSVGKSKKKVPTINKGRLKEILSEFYPHYLNNSYDSSFMLGAEN